MLEQLPAPWWGLVGLGLGAGVLSGLLGLGSGIVLIPVLVVLMLVPQKVAQGTALAVMVPMTLTGAIRYWMNPEIRIQPTVVALIVMGALVGAMIGTELASRLPASTLRRLFAVFVLIAGFRMLLKPGKKAVPPEEAVAQEKENPETKGENDG